ncbi:MAG: hypothetical protein FD177_2675 [Desulfovibrionaceae bacterium]|nr:MAG: hypothetical protein FD177_2675 [Desulfovibrionaceae bacterium]
MFVSMSLFPLADPIVDAVVDPERDFIIDPISGESWTPDGGVASPSTTP